MQEKKFDVIVLSLRGKTKFKIDGDYFKTLGEEYSWQNSVYTVRTFPENLKNPDGTRAYSKWTGGLLGVTIEQMEDFNDFHRKWYLEDMFQQKCLSQLFMTKTIEVVYENEVFKLLEKVELKLKEGEKVDIRIEDEKVVIKKIEPSLREYNDFLPRDFNLHFYQAANHVKT